MKHRAVIPVITSLLVVAFAAELQPPHGGIHTPLLSTEQESDLFVSLQQFVSGPHGDRLFLRMYESLNATLVALPKNAHGRLAPQVVRYALQNYFAKRHGWRLKGLDRLGVESHSWKALHELSIIRDKAPFVQSLLSDANLLEHGFSYAEVAALALALERLIFDDSIIVLDKAYEALNVSTSELLSLETLRQVIYAYVAMYSHGKTDELPPHLQVHLFRLDVAHTQGLDKDNPRVRLSYNEWFKLKEFVEDAVQRVIHSEGLDRNQFTSERYSYDHAWKVVEIVRERFGEHQNKDCLEMKQALIDVDPVGQGRVPLKFFYLKGESLYHWFEESPAYLMKTGSIDASQDGDPKVLVSNYVTGPANCIASFSHHSVCCLVECADVMGAIEQQLAAASALPEELLPIVTGISTPTVKAPREIHQELRKKLLSIAEYNGGRIPLYGRLFAQWLHFAFPYECTYPHVDHELFELEEDHMDPSQLVSKEELELVSEISKLGSGRQKFMDSWIDHEILFLEDDGTRKLLDWLLILESFIGAHEVLIVATLFLCGAFVVSKLQKRRRARTKAADFDDYFGDFEDSKKVWQKSRKAKELNKEAMKESNKREAAQKIAKAKLAKDQDESQNQKPSKTKRKKEGLAKKDDKLSVAQHKAKDEIKSISEDGIDKLSVAQHKAKDEIKSISEDGNISSDDSIYKNNQPESEPEDVSLKSEPEDVSLKSEPEAVAPAIEQDSGSWLPAAKTKQKKQTKGARQEDKEVQEKTRQERESMTLPSDGVVAQAMPAFDEPESVPQVDTSTERTVLPAQLSPPPGLLLPLQPCEPPGLLLPLQPCESDTNNVDHAYPTGVSPLQPPGLPMFRPPPGLEMFGNCPEASMAVPYPMRHEIAYVLPLGAPSGAAQCYPTTPSFGREALEAHLRELAAQLERERHAREQLELLLQGEGEGALPVQP